MSHPDQHPRRHSHWLAMLCLLCSVCGHASNRQDIQELRTLSYSVLENVLVYHNPQGSPFDSENATRYQVSLQRLHDHAAKLGRTDILEQTTRLAIAVAGLRNLPQSSTGIRTSIPPYSLWLLPIVEQQQKLVDELGTLYAETPSSSPVQQALNDLSQDVARLSLSYQLAVFPQLMAQIWTLDEAGASALDASIRQRFETLPRQYPEAAGTLEKLQRRYHFVHGHLAVPDKNVAPSAVERYLLSTSNDLDDLASRLSR
ncbi:hypothetical protein [Pseudomonas citronellolis]|uniref:hypothetical protein n=1 Tax=Pseudomonas citronellolis TaxID=53408 RepID=UPI003C2C0D57